MTDPVARRFTRLGAILALLAVAAGAFGAHALQPTFAATPAAAEWWRTAAHWHAIHALGLLALASVADRAPGKLVAVAGWLLVAGIVIFSGSLYAMALTSERALGAITPIGGAAFIAGWLCLALAAGKQPDTHTA